MKRSFIRDLALAVLAAAIPALRAQPAMLDPLSPPQNQGIAYTRSGRAAGIFKISDQVAVLAGNRYAFVKGYRVRLDDADPLHTSAILRDGEVYVPAAFAGYLTLDEVKPDAPAPDYLKDRWVYTIARPPYGLPGNIRAINVNGKTWVNFADAGRALGLHVFQDDSGLVCAGHKPDFDFTSHELNLHDSMMAAFDLPEKFASPRVAALYLLRFRKQFEQSRDEIAPTPMDIPVSSYNLTGFSFKLLGSKPPAPGMYPRLLFSPEDIPMLRERVKQNKTMQMALIEIEALFKKTWWDTATPDGQMFQKLANGEPATLTGEGQGAGLYAAGVNYPSNSLTTMALYCLLTGDDAHGKMAANAIYNYYKNLEPRVDEILAASETEFDSTPALTGFRESQWRGMDEVVAHLDLGLALDFAGQWMTAGQKDLLRRVIAKATYGRRINGRAPANLADIPGGLSQLLAIAAIEGLPGYDSEAYAADAEAARDFLDWGINAKGELAVTLPSNGGLQFQLLAMIVLARRGDNLWGHPHWRSLPAAQGRVVSANGAESPKPGVGPLDAQLLMEFNAFYPNNPTVDTLLSRSFPNFNPTNLDIEVYRSQLEGDTAGRLRQLKLLLPGPTSPGSSSSVLYDTDWRPASRAE